MKQKLINIDGAQPKSGKLSIALYPNGMLGHSGKAGSYYARVVNRRTLDMEDIFNDLHSEDEGLDTAAMLRNWNAALNAIAMRISSGISVNFGLGVLSPTVSGSFASEHAGFDRTRQRITVRYRPSADMQRTMAALEPVITQGKRNSPELRRVYDFGSHWDSARLQKGQTIESGSLSCGNLLILEGKFLCVAGDSEENGIYFDSAANPGQKVKLEASQLCHNKPSKLECIVPARLEKGGQYRIRIVTQYMNGGKCRKRPASCTSPTVFTAV